MLLEPERIRVSSALLRKNNIHLGGDTIAIGASTSSAGQTSAMFRKIYTRSRNAIAKLASQNSQRQAPRVELPRARASTLRPYAEVEASALGIEGMMSRFSMQVMDAMLSEQQTLRLEGHLVEFGVYKGRSAAVISAHARAKERLLLVDIERYITDETIANLFTNPEFWLGRSEDFSRSYSDASAFSKSVRFMHIDSGHGYRTTLGEMALADQLLAAHGVACLDDFTNLNYSQILPAIFKYLYTTRTDLTVFLVTDEKAYLCRKPWFETYGRFVLDDLLKEMSTRGNSAVTIARTDVDPEYRAFYLRSRAPGESDKYGENIYGQFYKSP